MAALTRESSFERLLSGMDRAYTPHYEARATRSEAARTISTWLKKTLKLKAVYKSMNASELSTIASSLSALSALDSASGSDSASFLTGQDILASKNFMEALSHFLNLLPSDPSLKKRNKQARSVRIISSSLLITQFPGLVLEEDGKPDTGKEATACYLAARVFKASFKRLVSVLLKSSTPLTTFRNYLIGYRFSLRNFLNAIDAWKLIDRDRLKHSFEVAYCESFMVIWSSQKILEKLTEKLVECSDSDRPGLQREFDDTAAFIAAGSNRLKQFRDMLCKLLGPREGRALLEELDAYLTSSTQAMDVHVEMKSENLSDSPVTGGQNGYDVLGGIEATTSLYPNSSSPQPLSPEATQLRRVAMMTGMGENNILHELCLNPKFQLPDPLLPLRPFNSATDGYNALAHASERHDEEHVRKLMQDSSDGGKGILKRMVIKTIEERFVANMTKSKVHSLSEVVVGGVYPVWFNMKNSNNPNDGLFIFAEIMSISNDRERMSCRYIVDNVVEDDVASSRVKLSSHPRDAVSSGFLSFVVDIRDRISALIPPRSNMHAELKSAIDLDLLKQMIENDAMSASDLVGLLSTIVSFVTKLQSPHGSSEFIAWFNPFAKYLNSQSDIDNALVYVPKFFEVTTERMEQIQLEMANYYLSCLASSNLVKRDAIQLFKKTVDDRIVDLVKQETTRVETSCSGEVEAQQHYGKYLPRTKEFLSFLVQEPFPAIVDYLKDVQVLSPDVEPSNLSSLRIGFDSGNEININIVIVARAFSLLLQRNVDLGKSDGAAHLPETFLWDGERLRNLKNEIDSLVLVTTLLISCRSYLLSIKKRLTSDQEMALQNMLYEVMRDSRVTLTEVVTTAQNFVRSSFGDGVSSAAPSTSLPSDWEKVLEESLKKCVSQSSPVFSLFLKRVHSVLVRALLDLPFTDLLTRYSMNSRSQLQQLKVIIQMGKILFSHNVKAFGDIYSSILRTLCVEAARETSTSLS